MRAWNILTKASLASLFLLLMITSVRAFGVSPTDIDSQYLRPGASLEEEFTLSRTDALEEMNVSIEPSLSGIESWFTYEPGANFVFGKGESTKTFKVKVSVPSDAEYKNYTGVIRVSAVNSNLSAGGVSIAQGVRLEVNLTVTKEEYRSLSILSIKALDSEVGKPIRIELVGQNHGNVDASPVVKIKVMNLLMEVLEEKELANFGFIQPNQTGTLIAEFETDLPSGEYYIEVQALLDGDILRSERLVFNINNISKETEDTQNTSFISSIKEFFKSNGRYALVLTSGMVLAIGVEITTYLVSGKIWAKKLAEGIILKSRVFRLGSNKYARAAFAFAMGFLIFLIAAIHPFIVKVLDRNTNSETLGVQDLGEADSSLEVVNPSIPIEYNIYEYPDEDSRILYIASDGEQFNVIEERDGWYKVQLYENTSGWLKKSIVKSSVTVDN